MAEHGRRRWLVAVAIWIALAAACEGVARLVWPELEGGIWTAPEVGEDGVVRYVVAGVPAARAVIEGRWLRVPVDATDPPLAANDPPRGRIVVVGDSITDGFGVPYAQIWWRVASEMLAQDVPDPPRIWPLAGIGSDLARVLLHLRRHIAAAQRAGHRVAGIVYQFNQNDVQDTAPPRGDPQAPPGVPQPPRAATGLAERLMVWRGTWGNRSVALRAATHFLYRWARGHGGCDERGPAALGQYAYAWGARPVRARAEALWQRVESDLTAFAAEAERAQIPFAVLLTPTVYDVDHHRDHRFAWGRESFDLDCRTIDPLQRLRQLDGRHGMRVVDAATPMHERYERERASGAPPRIFLVNDDNHLAVTGSAWFAEIFERDVLLPMLTRADR